MQTRSNELEHLVQVQYIKWEIPYEITVITQPLFEKHASGGPGFLYDTCVSEHHQVAGSCIVRPKNGNRTCFKEEKYSKNFAIMPVASIANIIASPHTIFRGGHCKLSLLNV